MPAGVRPRMTAGRVRPHNFNIIHPQADIMQARGNQQVSAVNNIFLKHDVNRFSRFKPGDMIEVVEMAVAVSVEWLRVLEFC